MILEMFYDELWNFLYSCLITYTYYASETNIFILNSGLESSYLHTIETIKMEIK